MRDVVLLLPVQQFVDTTPASGVAGRHVTAGLTTETTLSVTVRSTRWGHRTIGPALIAASSQWGAYRWGPVRANPAALVTLPVPAVFDAKSPTPRPAGLIGVNRSRRPGEGGEFASIRPFQVGDRLRRIHWPVSMRTGALHVTSTWADRDSQVLLIVDASHDLGLREGVDGAASSLDTAVRATGALAEHFLHKGDRVALRVFGRASVLELPSASGTTQLARVLDVLATVKADNREEVATMRGRLGVESGALVIVLSSLTSPAAIDTVMAMAAQGRAVVIVDTLPVLPPSIPDDTAVSLAWRIRVLERERDLRRLRHEGIPIAAWHGPGSLDPVLRAISRRFDAPRLTRR